jgi:hypothetical protein
MPHDIDTSVRAGFFSTVADADQAVRRLMAAGFSHTSWRLSVRTNSRTNSPLKFPKRRGRGPPPWRGLRRAASWARPWEG